MGQEGARIILVEGDRSAGERAADLLDAESIEGRLLVGDPASSAAARWSATTARLVWGRVDIVVYAATLPDVPGAVDIINPSVLDTFYRMDVRSPLLYCQAVIPAMMARGYGRIVTVASDCGADGRAYLSARASSQAALIGLTKAIAMSVAETGIRVNSVVRPDGEELSSRVASAVCWLASAECSYTTGATFEIGAVRP